MRINDLIAFFFLIVVVSCSKSNVNPNAQNIVGSWMLTEYLLDPGDGSGKWQKAADHEVVAFTADGTYSLTNSYGKTLSKFKIKSDSTFLLIDIAGSESSIVRYKFNSSQLELNPRCYETCGWRYQKIN